jgi:2-keto-4-pentenoate hydratase/2-oxohepta-3-ene-1,7-dioic acid hydratase in catechol pathway
MRFATLKTERGSAAAVWSDKGWVILSQLDESLGPDLLSLVSRSYDFEQLTALVHEFLRTSDTGLSYIADDDAVFDAPYRHPRMIWGIGLNYQDHARDLSEQAPDEPASFIKGDQTVIGHGQDIELPRLSGRVTAEAELGVIIGRYCYEVSEHVALDYVFGYCPVLDQTAEDILQRNPRFLTRSKNFPTFFSFGPEVVTQEELLRGRPIEDVIVSTVRVERDDADSTAWRDSEVRRNTVGKMMTGPAALISFHSHHMPLYPGDIISTGTPGALVIRDGDVVESRVGPLRVLRNPVRGQASQHSRE